MQMNLFVYDENMMCQSAMKVVLAIESGYHRRIAAIISLTNRFHVAVRLSGNRPQMTSICGARVFWWGVTDVVITFWLTLYLIDFFLFARLNLLNVLICIAKIAIFLPRVLMNQKRQISLPVGYKTARPKTGHWEWLWRHFRTSSFAKNRFLGHF